MLKLLTMALILTATACDALDAADGSKPSSPSGCCWLIGRSSIEGCLLRFVEYPGDCVHTCCAIDGYVLACEPDEHGATANPDEDTCDGVDTHV